MAWTPNREELAWAGGFLCGDGSFYVDPRPRANAVQNEPLALERFGKALQMGGLHGGHRIYGRAKKPMYQWRISGFEKTQATIAMLWPWLTEAKRKQARAVLTNGYCPSRQDGQRARQEWATNAAITRTRDEGGRFK